MGTRADFYVGRGLDAEWLGSIAWDGDPTGDPLEVTGETTEKQYRDVVALLLDGRDDATRPSDGWPWPWDDSQTTDFAYAFDGGKVYASCFGCAWWVPSKEQRPETENGAKVDFPNMKDRKNVTLGPRSGLIVMKAP